MITNKWFNTWQRMPDQPDDALTYFQDEFESRIVGVAITYVESADIAQSILEVATSQYSDQDVRDYTIGPDWADTIKYWTGPDVANRLFIRTNNALFEITSVRQERGGDFQRDPDLALDVLVSIVDYLGEEDIDPKNWWGTDPETTTINDEQDEGDTSPEESIDDDAELPPHLEMTFEQTAEEEGVQVDDIAIEGNELHVEYTAVDISQEALVGDMGSFVGAYAVIVDEGYGGERMIVQVHAVDGTYIGQYSVENEWAQTWFNEEMSNAEILARIESTIGLEDR